MSNVILDKEAIEFAGGFYLGLANGKNLDFAFRLGKNAIRAVGIREESVPILKKFDGVPRAVRTDNEIIGSYHQDYSHANEKVLVMVANPKNLPKLRLDEEVREIYGVLKLAKEEGQVAVEQRWAARFDDLVDALLEFNPTIVHFSGHGQNDGLFFEDEIGSAHLVGTRQISELLNCFSKQVKCVLINTEHSESLAKEIAKYIDYVIGFPTALLDKHFIHFAKGFYRAIGRRLSYKQAYELACAELDQKVSKDDFPILNTKG